MRRRRKGRTVLVVDDDPASRRHLTGMLERAGLVALAADNGMQLVRMLTVSQPDLIVMDPALSWLDGYELCRIIKNRKDWSRINVVMLTSRQEPEVRERAFAAGCEEIFQKPVSSEALVSGVRRLLQIPA
ncbi:response regulator [bacterium]|nr:response regulator [bacterium]